MVELMERKGKNTFKIVQIKPIKVSLYIDRYIDR